MNVPVLTTSKLEVEGALLLCSPQFEDKRGLFKETYNMMQFHDVGINYDWCQDNLAVSNANVLRGLHMQRKRPQGKLLTCLKGVIFDVGLDLRPTSKTFGQHAMVELDKPTKAVYWPPGTAHGYYSVTESIVIYKCTTLYDRESDGGVLWCDPALGIKWGDISPVVSHKDMCLPKLRDYLNSLS